MLNDAQSFSDTATNLCTSQAAAGQGREAGRKVAVVLVTTK